MSRRKKAEHQAKQITAAMEEAKKAAAKRREEALERLAKEEAEELRRYEADLAKARSQTLWTRGPEPAQTRPPLHRLRWMPGPQGVPPLQKTANGRRYPAQRLSPRPGAGQPLRSGSRANAPRAQDRRYRHLAILERYFSLTATSTSESYGGGLQDDGVQPPSASFCRGTRYTVELFGRTRPPLQAPAKAKPQGKSQTLPGPLSTETCGR